MTAVDVANELSKIAEKYQDAGQLRDLEGALRGLGASPPVLDRARRWATVNMHDVFLGEESPVGVRRSRFVHLFDVLTEVLVFFPIVVTWIGLAFATIAYESASRSHVLGGESFLQGWQDGFSGNLPGLLTFGHLAWYTVGIVSLLIVVVAVRAIYGKLVEEPLRRRLAAALARANLELAELRLGIPDQVAASLDLATDKLVDTAAAIEAAGRAATQVQQKAEDAVSAVDPALAGVRAATMAMTTATGALSTMPDKVGGHLDRMSGQFGDAIDQATGRLAVAANEATGKISGSVDSAGGRLGDAITDVARAQRDAVSAQLEAVKAQREVATSGSNSSKLLADALSDGASQVKGALKDVSGVAIGYAHRIEVAADVIGHAMDGLPSETGRVSTAVSQVGTVISQLETAVSGLRQDVAVISSQLSNLGPVNAQAAGGRSGAPGTQFQEAARELQASAADLRDAARVLRQSPDQFRAAASIGTSRWNPFRHL